MLPRCEAGPDPDSLTFGVWPGLESR